MGSFLLQGVTKGARNKILLSVKKLSERPELLSRLEKVRYTNNNIISCVGKVSVIFVVLVIVV